MALGDQYRIQAGHPGPAHKKVPPKGEHDWTVMVSFRLSKSEAAGAHEGMDAVLDKEHLDYMTPIVCMRCECSYDSVATIDCKGEPVGYLPDGRPMYHDGTFPDREWIPREQ